MKILVIEDDQNKLKQLSAYIRGRWAHCSITERRSYHSGLEAIKNDTYSLILLDMSMPTYDITPREPGGRPRIFAGSEILRQMERKKISAPVIIVTQFETFGEADKRISLAELQNQLSSQFPQNYIGTVYYNAAHDNWKKDLDVLIPVSLKTGEV